MNDNGSRCWDFPGSLVGKTVCFLPIQGAQIPSLVREVRSKVPHDIAKKKKKKSFLSHSFNKTIFLLKILLKIIFR